MKNVRVARRYAMALMTAAEEQRSVDRTAQDLDLIGGILRSSREFRVFVASPVVSAQKKAAVLKELFGASIKAETMDFLTLLLEKRREHILLDMIEQFTALRDDKLGIVNVDVTSAVEVTPQQQQVLQKQLELYAGKKVRMRLVLDAAIRGGLVIQVGDTVLNSSLTHQLALLRERFVTGTARLNES